MIYSLLICGFISYVEAATRDQQLDLTGHYVLMDPKEPYRWKWIEKDFCISVRPNGAEAEHLVSSNTTILNIYMDENAGALIPMEVLTCSWEYGRYTRNNQYACGFNNDVFDVFSSISSGGAQRYHLGRQVYANYRDIVLNPKN